MKASSAAYNKLTDFKNGLVDAQKYINDGEYIQGINKIDLMGGKTSQLGKSYANIDIVAEKGIKGSATDLDKFIKNNSIDEIVTNNPYNPTITDPFELFINNSQKIIKKGGTLVINGQPQNGLINRISIQKLEQAGFEVLEFKVPLKNKYRNLTFKTTNGHDIDPDTMISIIVKKN